MLYFVLLFYFYVKVKRFEQMNAILKLQGGLPIMLVIGVVYFGVFVDAAVDNTSHFGRPRPL